MSDQAGTEAAASSEPSSEVVSEQVPLYEASDEDIDAYMEDHTKKSKTLPPAKEQKGTAETPVVTKETQTDGQARQQKETPQNADFWKQKAAETEKALAERTERLKQQERYIQQRGTEIGNLRKEREELRAKLEEKLEDAVDLKESHKLLKERDKVDEELQNLSEQEQSMHRAHQTQVAVESVLSPDELNVEGMAALMQSEGVRAEYIEAFRQNPYGVASTDFIVQLGKRQLEQRSTMELIRYAQKLTEENKRLKGQPDDVVSKIQATLNTPPPLSANPSAGVQPKIAPGQIAELSDAEFEALAAEKLKGM